MRNFVVLATLAATTSAAAAEPAGLTEAADSAMPSSRLRVGTTLLAGFDFYSDAQLAVEGGYSLDPTFSLHALVATGLAADDQGSGTIRQARVGIEANPCTTHRLVCFYGGVDLGYQSVTWHGDPEFMSPDETHSNVTAVARAGFDVGGRHVRVRPGIETYHALSGQTAGGSAPLSLLGINFGLGIAYQW